MIINSFQDVEKVFGRNFGVWYLISKHQNLSEGFIREFKDKVNWYWISSHQNLSEGFIREFKDKVNWNEISIYQHLSEGFIREFDLSINPDNWLCWNRDQKIEAVKNSPYEFDGEYLYAFKAVRKDFHSVYSFRFQYLPGQTFETHCDCTSNENSFGFSGWTKEKALEYYNKGKIIKMKIHIDDLGRIVKGYKLRCKKFEVLEEIDV